MTLAGTISLLFARYKIDIVRHGANRREDPVPVSASISLITRTRGWIEERRVSAPALMTDLGVLNMIKPYVLQQKSFSAQGFALTTRSELLRGVIESICHRRKTLALRCRLHPSSIRHCSFVANALPSFLFVSLSLSLSPSHSFCFSLQGSCLLQLRRGCQRFVKILRDC